MSDRPPLNEAEATARRLLVDAVNDMLAGTLPFHEGAATVLWLQGSVGGIADHDADFLIFSAIVSATDHLPFRAQFPLWNPDALAKLEPDLERAQQWAASVAGDACRSLLWRFASRSDWSV